MPSASAKSKPRQREFPQALQEARLIQARNELDTFLFGLVNHECTSTSCRSCQLLTEIRAFIRERVFETVIYSRTE
jgi:hypothetical protein